MQLSCVNKMIMCTALQLEVQQCYLHDPCNSTSDTQNHKPCLLNINNLSIEHEIFIWSIMDELCSLSSSCMHSGRLCDIYTMIPCAILYV